MIRRIKRVKPKKRFTPVKVVDPVKTGDEREHLFLPPLEPRRKMFVILGIVTAIWIAFLIAMYLNTRKPIEPTQPATQPAELPAVAPEPAPSTNPA